MVTSHSLTYRSGSAGRIRRPGPPAGSAGDDDERAWSTRACDVDLEANEVRIATLKRRKAHWPEYPQTACVTLAPDWACEVLSASTRKLDPHRKRPLYAREGVGHLWLVEPTDRTLEAFELREGEWAPIAAAKDDDPIGIRPFDAIAFSLGDLWP